MGNSCVHAVKADTKALRDEVDSIHQKIDYLIYRLYMKEWHLDEGRPVHQHGLTFAQWLEGHALPPVKAP